MAGFILMSNTDLATVNKERALTYENKERENNYQITDLIAEHRDEAMRRQLQVGEKFMRKIDHFIETDDDPKHLGSLARTFDVVSNTIARAAKFDHVAKPQQEEQTQVKVGLFVQCSPVGLSQKEEKQCIDVEVTEG